VLLVQPLDKTCFGPLKKAVGELRAEISKTVAVTRANICGIVWKVGLSIVVLWSLTLSQAVLVCMSPATIQRGFRNSGIYPLNVSAISDYELAPPDAVLYNPALVSSSAASPIGASPLASETKLPAFPHILPKPRASKASSAISKRLSLRSVYGCWLTHAEQLQRLKEAAEFDPGAAEDAFDRKKSAKKRAKAKSASKPAAPLAERKSVSASLPDERELGSDSELNMDTDSDAEAQEEAPLRSSAATGSRMRTHVPIWASSAASDMHAAIRASLRSHPSAAPMRGKRAKS
jgi:hypothetical protein